GGLGAATGVFLVVHRRGAGPGAGPPEAVRVTTSRTDRGHWCRAGSGRSAGNGPEGRRWPPGPPARTQSEHPWPYSVWRRRSLQAQVAPERVGLVLPTEQPSLLQDGDHVVQDRKSVV